MNFDELKPDNDYCVYVDHDIWLMDDHKWAFYVWESYSIDCRQESGLSLIHIDYHFDHNDDVPNDSEQSRVIASRDKKKIFELVKEVERPIIYDSFIAPFVRLGRLDNIYWLCRQTEEDFGFTDDFLRRNSCAQFFDDSVETLLERQIAQPYIFDFCLDYFCDNDSDTFQGPVWSHEAIENTVSRCETLVKDATLITLSLSFGYSGTEDDTRRMVSSVLPRFVEMRASAT